MTKKRRTMRIKAIKFASADEAIQHIDASGRGVAIHVQGMNLVVDQREADRLGAAGVEFAYLFDHNGRIVTVPVP